MKYAQLKQVARQIASILVENEATVGDITDIFAETKEHLAIKLNPGGRPFGGSLPGCCGAIRLPDRAKDGDGVGDE